MVKEWFLKRIERAEQGINDPAKAEAMARASNKDRSDEVRNKVDDQYASRVSAFRAEGEENVAGAICDLEKKLNIKFSDNQIKTIREIIFSPERIS